jgi:AbrB family looped-hinge helix DNA binding protein
MITVTVSRRFQVVIPKEVREKVGIRPGQTLQVLQFGDRIELIPLRDIRSMRGFLKGMQTDVQREWDRTRLSWVLPGWPVGT